MTRLHSKKSKEYTGKKEQNATIPQIQLEIFLWVLLTIFYFIFSERKLNDYIKHYETLSYDMDTLHNDHLRSKRSTSKNKYIDLKFSAHGK